MQGAEEGQKDTQTSQVRHIVGAVAVLAVLTLLIRAPGLARPLLGNFATKNVVYGMIARNWAEGRADLWHPTVDVLCGDQRGWHMLEFPAAAYATSGVWQVLGGSLDSWGRLQAVAFSVASVLLLFLYVRRRHGLDAAAGAAITLALSPLAILYGQSFMLEASLVFFTVATFYTLDRWLRGSATCWLVLAAIAFALLLLTKIYMLVLLLPLGWMVVRSLWQPRAGADDSCSARRTSVVGCSATFALILALIPAALWYAHAYRSGTPDAPDVDRVFFSVHRSASEHLTERPMLLSADFYRQMLDDLTGVVLTPIGFALLLAGFLNRQWREHLPWLVAMVVLILALPRKFYEMNYYTMAVLPVLCVMIGLGWAEVRQRMRPGAMATGVLLLVALMFSMRYAARPAFVTPAEDRNVLAAAAAVRELTDDEEPVATYHGTGIALLYYCDRPGWAVPPTNPPLEDYARGGARYLVVVNSSESFGLTPVREGDGFTVYALPSP